MDQLHLNKLFLTYNKIIIEAILSLLVPISDEFSKLDKDHLYKQKQVIAGSSSRSGSAITTLKRQG